MSGVNESSPFTDACAPKAPVAVILEVIHGHAQPSAWELIQELENRFGPKARWNLTTALLEISEDRSQTHSARDYARDMLESDDLVEALQGRQRPGKEIESSIDALLHESDAYRASEAFQEMVSFMANFRDYAPFNNMLVRLQNPSCGLYATQRDWWRRFRRQLKEDARPMLILAPMHPVLLVYDLDQTEGDELPKHIREFARFTGEWEDQWLARTLQNAWERDRIRVEFKHLSSTHAGFATIAWGRDGSKMRIAIHDELDLPSRYGVLCHELAHVYLGHLGGDQDGWWPSRGNLLHGAMEVEAEATAYITARRAGLAGASSKYISRYLADDSVLKSVSIDQIAKVGGRIVDMATRQMRPRHTRGRSQNES